MSKFLSWRPVVESPPAASRCAGKAGRQISPSRFRAGVCSKSCRGIGLASAGLKAQVGGAICLSLRGEVCPGKLGAGPRCPRHGSSWRREGTFPGAKGLRGPPAAACAVVLGTRFFGECASSCSHRRRGPPAAESAVVHTSSEVGCLRRCSYERSTSVPGWCLP